MPLTIGYPRAVRAVHDLINLTLRALAVWTAVCVGRETICVAEKGTAVVARRRSAGAAMGGRLALGFEAIESCFGFEGHAGIGRLCFNCR